MLTQSLEYWLTELERVVIIVCAVLAAWKSYKSEKAALSNNNKLNNLSITIDGRMDQLLSSTKEAAMLSGAADGRASERAEIQSISKLQEMK